MSIPRSLVMAARSRLLNLKLKHTGGARPCLIVTVTASAHVLDGRESRHVSVIAESSSPSKLQGSIRYSPEPSQDRVCEPDSWLQCAPFTNHFLNTALIDRRSWHNRRLSVGETASTETWRAYLASAYTVLPPTLLEYRTGLASSRAHRRLYGIFSSHPHFSPGK